MFAEVVSGQSRFFRASFLKRISSLAAPVMLGMLSQVLMNIVDTAFIGRIGERADEGLASLGLGIIAMWVVGGMLNALSVGIQALTSRREGEVDYEKAGQVAFNGFVLAMLLGAAFGISGSLLADKIAPVLSNDPGVVAYIEDFLKYRFVGLWPMLVVIAFKAFFDGIGHTRIYMFSAFLMNAVNLFLAYILIFGHLGLPRMEVGGAALAATISGTIGALFILGISLLPQYRRYKIIRLSNLSPRIAASIIRVAYPSSIAAMFTTLGFLIFLRIVGIIGTVEQAASTIMINLASLSFLPCIALGTASATLVGQNLGAQKPKRAMVFGIEAAKLGALIMGSVGLLAFIFAPYILKAFTPHHDVIREGIKALRLLAVVQIFQASGLVFANSLMGAGDTRYVMFADVLLHYVILLPLTYLMGVTLQWGIYGAWGAIDIYIFLMGLFMGVRFLRGKWQKIKL